MSTYDESQRQEEADAAYARRLQAEEHDQTRDQTTASARTISQMNSDLLAKIEEQEQCDLPGHISKTKNKHAGAGLSRGLQSAVGGVAAGAAALVAAPVIGAKEGGGKGFAAGLGAGILGAVALTVSRHRVGRLRSRCRHREHARRDPSVGRRQGVGPLDQQLDLLRPQEGRSSISVHRSRRQAPRTYSQEAGETGPGNTDRTLRQGHEAL